MKKKIAMLLCATLFCASALTGCSNLDNAGTTASSRSAADSVVATESAAESETAADTADQSETAAESEAADTEASSENVTATEAAADISDSTVAGWQFIVEKLEKNKSLENVSVDLGYTGVETNDYVKEASDGNVYYLIKMQINKDGSTEAIDWASLKLTDSDGNEYTRIDDEFLTNLGMTRTAGTKLNFGSNEGWIAFEIKEDASGLTLSYPFESETYSCELPDLQ